MAERNSREPRRLRSFRFAGVVVLVIGVAVGVCVAVLTPWPNWAALSIVPFTALGTWLVLKAAIQPPRDR
jgi:cbb3-type cytochrome oxidase subunit 1